MWFFFEPLISPLPNRSSALGRRLGFVFVRSGAERRLLILTERDPLSVAAQSFDPFKVHSTAPAERHC